jgi:AcrR family transcriptional regulator
MTDEGGLRERKKLATRTALADSAFRLSVERGVDAITVEQIAVDAGVSLRTFFNYFSAKEEAVVAGDEGTAAGKLVAAFAERPADEPLMESLRRALADTVPPLVDRERMQQLRTLRSTPSLLPHQLAAFVAHEQGLAEAIAARLGTDVDDSYPLLVAAAVLAGLRITVQRWLDAPETPGRPTLRELIESAITRLDEGFGATRRPK